MQQLTVFTPTYNRSHLIKRLHEKLQEQTDKNFVWLIVDDGSTDDTREVVKELIHISEFDIKYIYKENGGKQSAVNVALDACKTEWFAFCDSDDWYLNNTVEKMNKKCKEIDFSSDICGIVARRGDHNLNCKSFPLIQEKEMILRLPELYEKYKFHAETCAVFRTRALQYAKYPDIHDRFIPESYMFDKYSQKYRVLFLDEVWSVTEYLPDGLTVQSNKLYHANPEGVMYALIEATKTNYGFKRNVKNIVSLLCWKTKYPTITTSEFALYRPECILFSYVAYALARIIKKPDWIWKEMN